MSRFKDFLTISMAKIQLGTLPHATLGIFLAANSIEDISTLSVLVYILLYFVLITFACNINCLYDYEVDKKYKSFRSEAIDRFGFKTVKTILAVEVVLALLLISYLYYNHHYLTAILAICGLFFSYAYSASPLRLKKRGVLSPIPVFIGLYTLPVLAGWFLLNYPLVSYFLVFVLGYALMNEGFTLVNTCEDYSEDASEGIRTWAHILGLKRTLTIASLFALGGFLCLLALAFKAITITVTLDLKTGASIILLGVLTLTLTISNLEVSKVRKGEDLEKAAKQSAPRMPKWFIITRYPMLIIALLLLL